MKRINEADTKSDNRRSHSWVSNQKIFKSPVSPEIAFAGTGYLKTSLFGSIQHDHEIDINIV